MRHAAQFEVCYFSPDIEIHNLRLPGTGGPHQVAVVLVKIKVVQYVFQLGDAGRELAGQVIELVALIAFLAPVFYYAPGFIERHSRRITETLEINSALVVVIVPVSLAVLFVHQLARVSAALQAMGRDSRP